MKSKPWIAINLLTNEVLGNYVTDTAAWSAHMNQPITVQYAPRAREVKK